MTDVPLWILVVLPFVAAFLALAGHGTIAWVAIQRFFQRVARRIDRVEGKADTVIRDVETAKTKIAEVRTEVDAKVGSIQTDVQGRILTLGRDFRESLGSLAGRVDATSRELSSYRDELSTRTEALSKQVSEVETRLGGRLPTDFGALVDGKLREFEQRVIAREARAEEMLRRDRQQMADTLSKSPQLAGAPGMQQLIQRLQVAGLPKRYQKYVGIIQAVSGGPMTPPNGGSPNASPGLAPFAPATPSTVYRGPGAPTPEPPPPVDAGRST